MSMLNDELIDAKANLCWNHQQQQLKGELPIDCICHQLMSMIVLTREEIAKEIEREHFFDATGRTPEYAVINIQERCAAIARGK